MARTNGPELRLCCTASQRNSAKLVGKSFRCHGISLSPFHSVPEMSVFVYGVGTSGWIQVLRRSVPACCLVPCIANSCSEKLSSLAVTFFMYINMIVCTQNYRKKSRGTFIEDILRQESLCCYANAQTRILGLNITRKHIKSSFFFQYYNYYLFYFF